MKLLQLLPFSRVSSERLLEILRASYWFVPGLLMLFAVMLATALLAVDRALALAEHDLPVWLAVGSVDSARSILGTQASSMITIASLTFSLTVVALTLAASQFGPRLIYNFMRDRSTQIVLGVFLGGFVYSLLVLRAIGSVGSNGEVPHLAILTGLLLSLLSAGVLVFFIHHLAESLQVNTLIARVSEELGDMIERFFPSAELAAATRDEREPPELAWPLTADRSGTLQAIDLVRLGEVVSEAELRLRMRVRPGDHLLESTVVLHSDVALGTELQARIRSCLLIGRRRTQVQDIEFGFHQLVEIALRALSPSINDPYTALACIDELGKALALVLQRGELPRTAAVDDGLVRIWLDSTSFPRIAHAAFDPIRQQGVAHPTVTIRLLETIGQLGPVARREEDRENLLLQAQLVLETGLPGAPTEHDGEIIRARYERTCRSIGLAGSVPGCDAATDGRPRHAGGESS